MNTLHEICHLIFAVRSLDFNGRINITFLVLSLFLSFSSNVLAYETSTFNCETSKQEVHSINIQVNYPTSADEELQVIKSEFESYESTPVVSTHGEDSVSSLIICQ